MVLSEISAVTNVRLDPNAVAVPLMVILLLTNAEFGILLNPAPLPLNIPDVKIVADEVTPAGVIKVPDIAAGS